MISAVQLYYKTKMRLNNLASNEHQDIPIEDWVLAANESQIKLIKKKLGLNNNYGIGYDGFRKRYEDLQTLVVPHVQLELKDDKSLNNRWSTIDSTVDLVPKYLIYSDIYITADKDNCKNRVLQVNISKHSDLAVLINNTNYKPSFEYQETLGTISNNKFEVYTDGTFSPNSLFISYIKYPKKINLEGYVDFDEKESITQDSELPDYLEDELLDLIVIELGMDTENNNAVTYGQIRSQNNE
jgi:hypothetical protein